MDRKLNKRELYKAALPPHTFYPLIETLDFSAISEGDGYYLQDYGIFADPLDEDAFALRLRITGGRIETTTLHALADIARRHGLEAILTARAGIQLHGLASENVLSVFQQVNALGITTWQTFGDNVRTIVTDVYDGVGRYGRIETYPLILQMENYFLKNPDLIGLLPRRLSTGISGNSANVTSLFANDLYFALADKGGTPGFNVYMGGKNTEVAVCADIFLPYEDVVPFFIAFVTAFNKHGLRFTRTRTRLFHLLEEIGMEAFKEHIAAEYGKSWESGGEPLREEGRFAPHERLRDGRFGFCYTTDFGRVSADELDQIASYAEKHDAQVRLGMDQNLYVLGLPRPHSPFEERTESETVVACAGSHYCPYSFWNIKDDAYLLPLGAIRKHRIQLGISGCAKGCGRHMHADIGLIGLRTGRFGGAEKAARIYLGAEHTSGNSVGRELFEMVPLEHLSSVLTAIIAEYEQSGFDRFETFAAHLLNRYSIDFLALWLLAKLATGSKISLSTLRNASAPHPATGPEEEKRLLRETFADEAFLTLIDDGLGEAVSRLGKQLWTLHQTAEPVAPRIHELLVSKKYWEQPKP